VLFDFCRKKLTIPPPIPEEDDVASQAFEDEDESRGLAQRLQNKKFGKFPGLLAKRVPDSHVPPPDSTLVQPPLAFASTSGVRLDRSSKQDDQFSLWLWLSLPPSFGKQRDLEWKT